jgi:predicted transcriptional regulator of viral defense system
MAVFDEVLALAVENQGYVTAGEARAAGLDPVVLRKLAATGRLERTAQGVYRVPMLAAGEYAAFAEAIAWSQGRGVISHESALDLLELCDVNPSVIHLTVPPTYTPRRRGGELYRVWRRKIDAKTIVHHDGIAVIGAGPSILDCLAYGTDPALLLQACTTAEREGYLTADQRASLQAQIQTRGIVLRRRSAS